MRCTSSPPKSRKSERRLKPCPIDATSRSWSQIRCVHPLAPARGGEPRVTPSRKACFLRHHAQRRPLLHHQSPVQRQVILRHALGGKSFLEPRADRFA